MATTNPTPQQQHLLEQMDLFWNLAVKAHLNHWTEASNQYFKKVFEARDNLRATGYVFPDEEADEWF